MKKKGFTLIELLVVVGVIALLLGLLLPSLQKAKRQVRSVVCRSNLRQLGMGLQLYLDSNNNKMISQAKGPWFLALESYLSGNSDLRLCPETRQVEESLAEAVLFAQSSTDKVPHRRATANSPWVYAIEEPTVASAYSTGDCHVVVYDPSDDTQTTSVGYSFEPGSYGFNGWLYSDNQTVDSTLTSSILYNHVGDVRIPSQTPAFGDCNWVDSWPRNTDEVREDINYSQGDVTDPLKETQNKWAMGRFLVNRHFDMSSNLVFLDGSVNNIRMEQLWTLQWHQGAKPVFNKELPPGSENDDGSIRTY